MSSQAGQQIITTCILHNISRSKEQTLKFGLLIKYNVRNIFFFKNHPENETGKLASELFLFFKKALYKVKASL